MVEIIDGLYISSAPDFYNYVSYEALIIEWLNQGIEVIISLREFEPLEVAYKAMNFTFHHIPVHNLDVPSKGDVERFIDIVDANAGRKILVHCFAGLGRSGTMVALYLKYNGMKGKEAITFVRAKRPGAIETIEQEQFVLDYDFEE